MELKEKKTEVLSFTEDEESALYKVIGMFSELYHDYMIYGSYLDLPFDNDTDLDQIDYDEIDRVYSVLAHIYNNKEKLPIVIDYN